MENKNINDRRQDGQGAPGQKQSGWLKYPRKAMSGVVYSATIVIMLAVSLLFSFTLTAVVSSTGTELEILQEQDWYKYLSYGLYQAAYIAVVLLFAFLYRQKPRDFGYRKTHPKYFVIALLAAFGLLFSLNWVNGQFIKLFELIGYTAPESSLPSLEGGGIVGVLIVVAVLPAILEETIFRGLMLEGIKDVGTVAACLLGGLLFSVFHQNPAQTAYQFVCGAAFTLLAIRADSLVPAILMHFVNNALIIFDARFGFLSNLSGGGAAALYAVSGVCLAAALVWLIFFEKKTNRKKEGPIRPFLYPALTGIILCGVIWVYNLVVYIA